MKRLSLQWISLTAAAAVLAAGCAAGPNRAPERNVPQGNNVSTTTGDADACAVALGNTVGPGGTMNPGDAGGNNVTGRTGTGNSEVTANGLIIGNVALVALPSTDNMPTTPGAPGAGTPGAGTTGAAPGTTGAAATGTAAGTVGAPAANPGGMDMGRDMGAAGTTVGTPGTRTAADTILPGTKTAPAPITGAAAPPNPVVTAPVTPGNPNANGAPGGTLDNRANAPTPAGTVGTVGGEADAVERIKVACDKLVDIRVVNNANDRVALARVTDAIREGRPITDFMTDINRMVQAGTSVGGGRNANRGAGDRNLVPGAPAAPALDPDVRGIEVPPADPDRAGAPAVPAVPTTPAAPGAR